MDVFIFQSFSHSFYGLFDQEGHNALDQTEFFEMLKLNARLVKISIRLKQPQLKKNSVLINFGFVNCKCFAIQIKLRFI
jgi:hypothetical protein